MSYITSYDSEWSPENKLILEREFGGPRGPMTGFACSSAVSEDQDDHFRPIGALVAKLTQDLAWNDAAIRDIADYYRLAKLWGNGSGNMNAWPLSVYSDEVRLKIEAGAFTQGKSWDEWIIYGM